MLFALGGSLTCLGRATLQFICSWWIMVPQVFFFFLILSFSFLTRLLECRPTWGQTLARWPKLALRVYKCIIIARPNPPLLSSTFTSQNGLLLMANGCCEISIRRLQLKKGLSVFVYFCLNLIVQYWINVFCLFHIQVEGKIVSLSKGLFFFKKYQCWPVT